MIPQAEFASAVPVSGDFVRKAFGESLDPRIFNGCRETAAHPRKAPESPMEAAFRTAA